MTDPQFIHLRNHSAYSLSEGAIRMGELIGLAEEHNLPAVALTDTNNLFGALEFSQAASKAGIQPIIGCELKVCFELDDRQTLSKIVLLAKDEQGYANLLKLTSKAFVETDSQYTPHVIVDDLHDFSAGLICLTGGTDGAIGELLQARNPKGAEARFVLLKELYPEHLYVELHRHGRAEDDLCEPDLVRFAHTHHVPLVATNNSLFPKKEMFEAQDCLMCIAHGRYLTEGDRPRYTPEHYFKSPQDMATLFADIPEAISNTVVIAKRCGCMSHPHAPMLPRFPTGEGRSEQEEFAHVAREGLDMRLETVVFPTQEQARGKALTEDDKAEIAAAYFERLDYEIDIITRMDFPGYFLIVSDFIRWSKEQAIPVGPGRGSGAGSLVAWSMQITDLDPLQFGLLFERFLNPERVSMPDFDIDFCQERRDEVIRYVQDKYGETQVAQIITFGKLQARAVVRDVGRVLQMSYGQVDNICKRIPNNPANPVTLQQAIDLDPELKADKKAGGDVARLLELGLQLEGMYRHAGTHAAGVVIGAKRLDELVPLYRDPRSTIPATQFAMKYAEMAGLVKFDFLGLKTLTQIQYAVDLVNEGLNQESGTRNQESAVGNQESGFQIAHIPLSDPATFDMLGRGHSTGVFQIESSGMRDALRKMKPDSLEDLIALISLYRPGPMENIPTYIARKHGKEQPDYLHEKLTNCLKETYGVIIYQEQVMEIARLLAGYSLGDADLLRRAMGKKIKEEMDKQRAMFMDGAKKNQVDPKKAGEIFDLVAKFAGYGFNKSHAAAYALIGYQTAYLKANYPVEFLVGSLNMELHDTDKISTFIQEAQRSNIIVLPPDINKSSPRFTVESLPEDQQQEGKRKRAIRYGLGALKGVGEEAMKALVECRNEVGGRFEDIAQLAANANTTVMNKRQIESLAKAGAFDSIHPNRRQLFEAATLLTRHAQTAQEERESNQVSLFEGFAETKAESFLVLPEMDDWDVAERLAMEREAVGFYLTAHPLMRYESALSEFDIVPGAEVEDRIKPGETKSMLLAGVPMDLMVRSGQRGRFAYLQLSDPSGTHEVGVFSERLIDAHRDVMEGDEPLLVRVEVRCDEGGVRLSAESVTSLADYVKEQIRDIDIAVTDTGMLREVQQFVSTLAPGNTKVSLHITTQNHYRVTVRLAGGVAVSPEVISALSKLEAVEQKVAA